MKDSLARKFNFKTENFSSYFLLELSKPSIQNKAFELHGDPNISISRAYKVLLGAEIGFVIKVSHWINANIGLGFIQGSLNTKGYIGNKSVESFKLKSQMFVLNPSVGLELKLYRNEFQRFYFFISGGWGNLHLENKYEFTEDGLDHFSLDENMKNFKESLKSDFISREIGLGWEALFVDIATLFLGVGYYQRPVKRLNFKKSTSTLFQGSAPPGSQAKYRDGTTRAFDLNSFFVHLGFRFYLF